MLDYARRFENLRLEMENSLAELRDNSAGTLTVGANESTSLYLLRHIENFRRLHPKITVRVRRSLSSKIPNELLDGNLELGVISYDPGHDRLQSKVIYSDSLVFVVSPKHPLAKRKSVPIQELAGEAGDEIVKDCEAEIAGEEQQFRMAGSHFSQGADESISHG